MKVNMKLENQLASSCIKKIVPFMALLGIFFCLTSCNMWYQDWKGYLEYWSGTVQIGRVEVSGVSITKNAAGIGTIPVNSTPIFTGYIINPKEYGIADSIGDLSSNSSVQVTSAVQNNVSVIGNEATMLQVQIAPVDSSLEHTDLTVNFRPVRQDTGTSVGETMGITLQYNTPPQAPVAVAWDAATNQFSLMQGKKGWEVTSDTNSDKDGWIYWAWPQNMRNGVATETEPNCVASFSINGARHEASSLLTGDKLSGYEIYRYKVGVGTKVELRAFDSEGVQGKALYSGSVPYIFTLKGNGGTFNGASSTEVYFQKASIVEKTELPEPQQAGRIFTGWVDEATGNPYDFSKPVTQDKTLTAQWSQEIYVNGPAGSDSNYGSATDPVKSMEKALEKIYAANDGTRQYTIYVQADYESSHAFSSGSSLINITPEKDLKLTIKSAGSAIYSINAKNTKRVFRVAPASGVNLQLTMENLKITNGNAGNDNGRGGGLYILGGTITIQGSTTISNNTATEGGGICLENGTLTVESNVLITNNKAENTGGIGGGIALVDPVDSQSAPILKNWGNITGNSASYGGNDLAVTAFAGEYKILGSGVIGDIY